MELDLFRGVVPFVVVAEEKSFRRAAARLGVSPAAVSKAVAALEAAVGQTLFQRTTRSVSLTPAGATFFERCQQAVASVRGARAVLASARSEPSGVLALSVPFIAAPLVVPALGALSSRFPRLRFDVRVSDRVSRLAEEGVDVAIRIGVLPDSRLVAKRLRRTVLHTVASPSYLARRATPKKLDDLRGLQCLSVRGPDQKPRAFLFASGPFPVDAFLVADHAPTSLEAAVAGLGVTQAFDFMVQPLLASGALVEVLSDERATGPDVFAVCLPGRRAAANVRVAFEALAEHFAHAG